MFLAMLLAIAAFGDFFGSLDITVILIEVSPEHDSQNISECSRLSSSEEIFLDLGEKSWLSHLKNRHRVLMFIPVP